MGVLVEDLGLTTETGGSHNGSGRELLQALCSGADEDITDILAREVAGKNGSCWQVSGDILSRQKIDVREGKDREIAGTLTFIE